MTSSPLRGKVTTARSSWPRGQLELELGARALGHVEVDVGVAGPQEVEELGDEPAAGGADHAEADGAHHFLRAGR